VPKQGNESGISVSVSVLAQLLRYLARKKVDAKRIFRGAGVDPEALDRPDTRISLEDYIAIEDEAVRLSEDPYFGLHMGEFFEAGNWSILGYMMMSCRTLGEASEKAARYQKIIGSVIRAKGYLGFKKVTVVLMTPPHSPKLSRHCFEAALSSYVRMMRSLCGRHVSPMEVGFDDEPPPSKAEYERVFCCPVHFNRKRTYIVFDIRLGKVPVLTPNASLLAHFEAYARELVSEIEGNDGTTREVIRRILSRMDGGTLSIRGVAREMGHERQDFAEQAQERRQGLQRHSGGDPGAGGEEAPEGKLYRGRHHLPPRLFRTELFQEGVQEMDGRHSQGIS
jgi:hypothetical protein